MLKIAWAVLVFRPFHKVDSLWGSQAKSQLKNATRWASLKRQAMKGSEEWVKHYCSETWGKKKCLQKLNRVFKNKRLNTACAVWHAIALERDSNEFILELSLHFWLLPYANRIRMWKSHGAKGESWKRKTARGRRKTVVYFLAQSVKFMTSEICVLASPLRCGENGKNITFYRFHTRKFCAAPGKH